ncbi:MAG: hypothetical protein KDD50_03770, partial [Bdellovibrionales bacterium]|nr:hypothetical protein [Bdellovibrionales bacterium]
AFRLTTYQDAKWIVRRMAQSLSKEDWDEMIEYAHYPKELEGWAKAKVLHCVDNLYKLFDVKQKYNYELPSLKISNQYLDKGKLTVERIPGYPQRFGHGDRESPIQDGDLFRYVKITGITSLIKEGLNKINEKLVIQGISDLADNRREELKKRVMKHIQEKPWEPLYLDVESWGGPVADISLNTSRHVTTGTFFGSTASIQLVDTVSAGFSLGYFRALDGLENFSPAAMGNVKVYRNYVHVKPVASLKEADSVDWTKIYVPNFMNGLGEGLITQFDMKAQCEKIAKENDEIIANHPQDSSEKPILKNCLHPFDEFMKQLKLGEVLTVTDSIGVGGFLSGTSNVATLMGLDPVSYVTNIRLGLDLQHVFLHQTVITRTKDGLQVSFRKGDDDIAGIQFDLNYFLNILRIRAEGKSSKLKSKVYVLDYNPDVSLTPAEFDAVSDEESKKEHIKHNDRRENLTASIRYVLLENDGELLGANFKDNQFGVDINLESQKVTTKFLWNKTEDFEEGEYLKLLYPANPDYPDLKPEDELVEVYSYRKGSLRGGDWLGLFSDVLDGWLEKSGVIASTDDPNPSNKPFGSANWRLITSETDLTRNGETYPSVSIIKDVWGGWKTSPDEFFAILNRINDKFSDLGSYNIIDINNFSSLKSIDFYRITASLAISESGMDKIKDLFQSAEYDNLDHKNLKNPHPVPLLLTLFERLATHVDLGVDYLRSGYQDPNHGKYLASDKVFYDRFLSLLGGGSLENGTRMYMQRCVEEHESDADMNPSHNISYRYQTLYECLSGWFVGFLQAKRGFPRESRVDQTEWMTLTLDELLKIIPLKNILEYIGKENYLLTVRVNGFRNGEEDGDLEFFGNTLGDPGDMFETANGVINLYSKDTGVLNTELYKSHGSFR